VRPEPNHLGWRSPRSPSLSTAAGYPFLDSPCCKGYAFWLNRRFFIWAAIVGLVIDRIPKLVVHGLFRSGEFSGGREFHLLGDVLKVTYAMNPHGLFSLNYGPPFMYFLLPLAAAALVVWFGLRADDRWSATAFGLILSGALGNVVDRAGLSYVIDYLAFNIPGHPVSLFGRFTIIPGPVFNLADAFVFAGAVMLLGRELLGRAPGTRGQGLAAGPRATDSRASVETAAAPVEGKQLPA
jgi:signal peptidase II